MTPTPTRSGLVAEIISIGDEMTSGARLDTNSQWLSRELGSLGIRVLFHSTVGDSLSACVDVFKLATQRATVIVSTGGLGPTEDDLTRQAIADAFQCPLEFRPEALEHIEKLFSLRNRNMPEGNRIQAMFPNSSLMIHNPQGTAPGIDLTIRPSSANCAADDLSTTQSPRHDQDTVYPRVFALPGVPAEMFGMFNDTVRPRLLEHLRTRDVIQRLVIKCFGLGESDMEAQLGGMIARQHSPLVGITVSKATISLRIDAQAPTAAAATEQLESARSTIIERAGEYIFGEGDDYELQHAVVDRLRQSKQSVCVLEIGHASIVSGWLASVESPQSFAGGLSFPSLTAAQHLLGTSEQTPMENADGLSQLAINMRQALCADWCIAVAPYPSLVPEEGKILPAAPVDFAIVDPQNKVHLVTHTLGGHPEILHDRIAKTALFQLFKLLHNEVS